MEKIMTVEIHDKVFKETYTAFTFVFLRRGGILHLGDPRPAYVHKNLREASVKVKVPSGHL